MVESRNIYSKNYSLMVKIQKNLFYLFFFFFFCLIRKLLSGNMNSWAALVLEKCVGITEWSFHKAFVLTSHERCIGVCGTRGMAHVDSSETEVDYVDVITASLLTVALQPSRRHSLNSNCFIWAVLSSCLTAYYHMQATGLLTSSAGSN